MYCEIYKRDYDQDQTQIRILPVWFERDLQIPSADTTDIQLVSIQLLHICIILNWNRTP